MKKKRVEDSTTIISQVMMPTDANNQGFVHGGNILKLVDQAAGVCAMRHSESMCVTAAIDAVHFIEPIKLGELVTLKASVNYVGHTSMEIGVRIESEDLKTRKVRHTNSCYLTMVAIDNKGKPKKVPKLECVSKEQMKRCKRAEMRRKIKLKELKEIKKSLKKN
ncbi:MAG: acyl-CoA thioesterase [Nanoarchaeota archaeon]|nr:acyl-CoA thioesterase [Nanoarchaeota archaeon]